MMSRRVPAWVSVTVVLVGLLSAVVASAHHVLGRPSYSLNEDSNTPPSMNLETQIGDYFVSAMVYPAFPRPHEPGRINFYATHLDTGAPLDAQVAFSVRDDRWWSAAVESLGAQVLDDNVYRQGFVFSEAGAYIVTASFHAGGEPYQIDIPLRVGASSGLGPIGWTVLTIVVVLVGVSTIRRRGLLRARVQTGRAEIAAGMEDR